MWIYSCISILVFWYPCFHSHIFMSWYFRIFILMLQVEGDSVTLTFEMKSGREHSTPDKAMWGFSCIVRPQETAEDSSGGLPFLLDLYLSLSSISCSLIGQLFVGAPPTPDETACGSLMESLLLQRSVN